MHINWEDIAPLICPACNGECNANNHGPDNGKSPDRFVKDSGCESQDVYEAAERVAAYVNDLARLQAKGWENAQKLMADARRTDPNYIKLKYWWSADKKWFCVMSDDGNQQATISLTVEEASLLSMNAEPPIETIPSAEAREERIARDNGASALTSKD
jgi:hypothetical protein